MTSARRRGSRVARGAVALLAAAVLGLVVILALRTPATDRDWYPYLARTALVEAREGGGYRVAPVSDWRYLPGGIREEVWTEAIVDPAALRRMLFVLEPQPGSALAAHTLLLFEFEDGRLLGLTIEARRERDETYSAVRGLLRSYELAYHWGTARDLLTRRAVMLDHEVFVYALETEAATNVALLERLLAETARLVDTPRFYDTIRSNCTNELAKAAGLPWSPEFVLTGRSDEFLHARGFLAGGDFAAARERADLTAWLRTAPDRDFDGALLRELARRHGS
jgi:hypothetical protein